MKNVLRLLVLTVVAVIIMAFLLLSVAPSLLVRNVINKHSEELLGIKMSCSGVKISIFNGNGSVSGLKIYNPPGHKYHYDSLVSFNKISFGILKKELFHKRVHITDLAFVAPVINYEQYVDYSNFSRAIAILKGNAALPRSPADTQRNKTTEKVQGYNIMIDSMLIKNATANIYFGLTDKEVLQVSVPDIAMNRIGGDYGVQIPRIAGDILIAINQKILNNIIEKQFGNMSIIDGNKDKGGSRLMDGIKKLMPGK